MSTDPKKHQDTLDRHISEWRVNATLPPRFQEKVWERIERAETISRAGLWELFRAAIGRIVVRPRFAYSYVMLALAGGLVLGFWQGRAESSSVDSDLGRRYIQSIDPYQKPRAL